MLIVMKFGGSSLSSSERLENVANIIAEKSREGNDIVVVVSARGKTTDELVKQGLTICKYPAPRENDVLLSTGEQVSISLMAMQLQKLGCSAVSLCGWQAGILTDNTFGNAIITEIDTTRIFSELQSGKIVIIAGFQGVTAGSDITTLGRGGSDTTAIALSAALSADACYIYTDVNGVFSADPRNAKNAVRHDEISYNEMLEMSNLGAKVLHNRSVSLAKRQRVSFEVRSSFEDTKGTLVHDFAEGKYISGIICQEGVSMLTISGIDEGKSTCELFTLLAVNDVGVDVILRTQKVDEGASVSFSVSDSVCEHVAEIIKKSALSYKSISVQKGLAKVSAVGSGLADSCKVAAMILTELCELGIYPQYITTGEIRISVIIPEEIAKDAERALNTLFFAKE